jgi:N-acetylneuraminic acid mutarotase
MKKYLFNVLTFLLVFTFYNNLNAQGFIWVKGAATTNSAGAYGNLGSINIGNNPGARQGATSWKDAAGNFWMFGGDGYDFIGNQGLLCDLWKYDPLTNTWIWVKGPNVISQIGVYGTLGVASNTIFPGSRVSASSWVDASGNVYLFGGYGYDGIVTLGLLNDLWKYNPTTNQWTWLKGNLVGNQTGNYSTIGVSTSSNVPGGRQGSTTWIDNAGNLWLFGGFGISNNFANNEYLNDLWKYNVTTNEWVWMSGNNTGNQTGNYGSMGVSSATNMPGGRTLSAAWKDASGNFLLFGGLGYDNSNSNKNLNDLWKYDLTLNEWVWLKGNNTGNQNGVYGSMGVANAANTPGGRYGADTWKDSFGNFWLSSGDGNSALNQGLLNDVWLYNAASNNWSWIAGAGNSNLPGVYGTINTPGSSNIFGARKNSSAWLDANNNLWLFGGFGQPQTGTQGYLNDLWKYTNCVNNPITLTITTGNTLPCAKETISLTVTGSNSYTWNTGQNTSFLVITPTITTTYSAYTSNTNGCVYVAAFTQSVNSCVSIHQNSNLNAEILIFPNPSNGKLFFSSNGFPNCTIRIMDMSGKLVCTEEMTPFKNNLELELNKGFYFYEVLENNMRLKTGKILIE